MTKSLQANALAALVATLLGLAFAARALPAGETAAAGETLRHLEQQLGSGACTGDAQCRVIGVGVRACGGPERFYAYSALDVDEPALRRLAARHAEQRVQAQQRSGEMSTCEIVEPPLATCRMAQPSLPGRCVLTAVRRGAGAVHSR
jgi:hypothetical protein